MIAYSPAERVRDDQTRCPDSRKGRYQPFSYYAPPTKKCCRGLENGNILIDIPRRLARRDELGVGAINGKRLTLDRLLSSIDMLGHVSMLMLMLLLLGNRFLVREVIAGEGFDVRAVRFQHLLVSF